jgi:hypothetical protein
LSVKGRAPSLSWKSVSYTILTYAGVALIFTALGMLLAPPAAQVGGTRPEEAIPGHVAELAAFGLLLGLASMAIYGTKGLPLAFLMPVLTVLLDIDHLPAYLGIVETIRPAHSLVFVVFALAATAITIKALDIELVVASSFMAHMAVDTGLFAPFSPITFGYVELGPYRLPFAAGAVVCALAAGAVLRMRASVGGNGGPSVSA